MKKASYRFLLCIKSYLTLILQLKMAQNPVKVIFYHVINNMNYQDYAEKYLFSLLPDKASGWFYLWKQVCIPISEFLANNDNYKILSFN